MERQRTIGQYRAMDLVLFAIMLAIFESLVVIAARRWFPNEPYTVSVVPAVTAIVMMRWGPWAGLHAALGGAVFCLVSGARPAHYAIYIIGNLFSLGALGLIRALTPEGIRTSVMKSLGFGLAVTLLMQLGRALVAFLMGAEVKTCFDFFTTDALSGIFTMVILWIAARLDGILEDQKTYLLRVNKEREEEKGGF